jgi:hypothetical protein
MTRTLTRLEAGLPKVLDRGRRMLKQRAKAISVVK